MHRGRKPLVLTLYRMGYLNDLLSKMQALDPADIESSMIASTEDDLIAIQKDQLLHGLNAEGQKIGEYKSEAYANYKHALNPLAGFPNKDLRNKGDYYQGITATLVGDALVIESTDPKAEAVEALSGNALGLNPESKSKYIAEHLRPEFKKEIKARTGLRFG